MDGGVANRGCSLRIPDPNFILSRIPHSGSKRFSYPGSGSASASNNLSILTQKNVFKLSELWSGMFNPDSDLDFLLIPDKWFKTQKGTGFRIRNRNTDGRCSFQCCGTGRVGSAPCCMIRSSINTKARTWIFYFFSPEHLNMLSKIPIMTPSPLMGKEIIVNCHCCE